MYYRVIKLKHAKDHLGCVDKDMRVLNITIVRIKEGALGNINIGIPENYLIY